MPTNIFRVIQQNEKMPNGFADGNELYANYF